MDEGMVTLFMGSEFKGMSFFGTNFFGDIRIPYLFAVLNQRSCTATAGKANVRKVISAASGAAKSESATPLHEYTEIINHKVE